MTYFVIHDASQYDMVNQNGEQILLQKSYN